MDEIEEMEKQRSIEIKFIDAIKSNDVKSVTQNIDQVSHVIMRRGLNVSIGKKNVEITRLILSRTSMTLANEHYTSIGQSGSIEILKVVVDSLNYQPLFYYILDAAATSGEFDLIKYILNNCAIDTTSTDHALEVAIAHGWYEIIKILVDSGATIHSSEFIHVGIYELIRKWIYLNHMFKWTIEFLDDDPDFLLQTFKSISPTKIGTEFLKKHEIKYTKNIIQIFENTPFINDQIDLLKLSSFLIHDFRIQAGRTIQNSNIWRNHSSEIRKSHKNAKKIEKILSI